MLKIYIYPFQYIYWLINILAKDRIIGLLTSVFFVVSPLHTGAVSYISGRADPLSALFLILCFICYVKFLVTNRITVYFLMIVIYVLALLSRESSLILPILLLHYHYSLRKKFSFKVFLPILILTFIYDADAYCEYPKIINIKTKITAIPPLLKSCISFFYKITF